MLVSVLPLGLAHLPVVYADRLARARLRRADFAASTTTDSALLLRSFADDQLRLVSALTSTGPTAPQLNLLRTRFEEVVALAMIGAGPLVAIGRPGERLAELGAARTYWADEDWQRAVQDTAYRVERVIMIAGLTEGLAWEIGKLREWGMLRKLLVLVPPDNPERSSARIERIVEDLGIEGFPYGEVPSPMVIGFGFDRDATPIVYLADGPTWDAYLWATLIQHQLLTSAPELPASSSQHDDGSSPEQMPAPSLTPPRAVRTADVADPGVAHPGDGRTEPPRPAPSKPPLSASLSRPGLPFADDPQFRRYSNGAVKVMLMAREEAKRIGDDLVARNHLLLALAEFAPGLVEEVLGRSAVEVREAVIANSPPGYSMAPDPRASSEPFRSFLRYVPSVADSLGHERIEVRDQLLALLTPDVQGGIVANALADLGLQDDRVR